MILHTLWRRLVAPIDPFLFAILAALLGGAYMMMMSASPERLQTHTINLVISLTLMWVVANVPPQRLQLFALPLYVAGVILLLAVEFFGEISKGAQRWLDLGFIRMQPSEIMKIAMPLMLAWYFQKREGSLKFRDFLVAVALLLVPVGLIVTQPDLGTALLVTGAGFFVIYFGGLSWKLIVPATLLGVVMIVGIVAYESQICANGVEWPGLREYQKHRVCMLLDPSSDPRGKGFHTIQSTIAVGSGGLLGKGWQQGTQTHLDFLPERHTDFILAVLSEEFGMLGVLVLLALYCLLAGALTMNFFTSAFVNMGMVSGILPVVGVPLPLVSYGGTALVTLCIGMGILMSIQRHRKRA